MATANDVIKQALQEIGVLAPGVEPQAGEAVDALTRLNWMLHGLEQKGIKFGHSDMKAAEEFVIPADQIEAIMYLLAVKLAPSYEVDVKAETRTEADDGERLLQAHYADPDTADIDLGLLNMPGRARTTC